MSKQEPEVKATDSDDESPEDENIQLEINEAIFTLNTAVCSLNKAMLQLQQKLERCQQHMAEEQIEIPKTIH